MKSFGVKETKFKSTTTVIMKLYYPLAAEEIQKYCLDLYNEEPLLFKKVKKSTELPENKLLPGMEETLRYLSLTAISKDKLTPSFLIDLIWHEFILFTRLYSHFCNQYFGRYIHHNPSGNTEENKKQYVICLDLYRRYYGEPDSYFWKGRYDLILESNCGGCNSF